MDKSKEEKLKEVDPEPKQAEEDAERAAEAELTQAAAEFEREAQAHRKQAERVRRVSYLKGTTPRCTNCNKNRRSLKTCYVTRANNSRRRPN